MKSILTAACCSLLHFASTSQNNNKTFENAILFTNSASGYLNSNPDSSIYYIRKLAANSNYGKFDFFTNFIHNQFAQLFGHKDLKDFTAKEVSILNSRISSRRQMLIQLQNDTSRLIKKTVGPIYFVIQVKDHINDDQALTSLVNEFIEKELSGNVYENRQARYGLFIYNLISNKQQLKPVAQRLLKTIKDNLLAGQVPVTDSTGRIELEQRAWYRYLYAYACYNESKECKDINNKEALLEEVFKFSPDAIDKSNKSAYFYDMIFLINRDKESYQDEYLNFLKEQAADKSKVLSALTQMALTDPSYKKQLKEYYQENYSREKPYTEYWLEYVIKSAKEGAPAINLTLLDQTSYSTRNQTGKWVLVDFWGTWCGPCRDEHPDLEKFYRTAILPNSTKMSLITIACRDSYAKVTQYMKEKGFSFPVALSDDMVEHLYNVQGYPTKILITPKGGYMVIPFGIDWVSYIKQMVNL